MRYILFFLLSFVLLPAQAIEVGQTYRIASKKFPTKSLFVQDSKREAGTDIVLWTETDVPSQQWKLTSGGSATNFALQNIYTALYAAPQSKTAGSKLTTIATRSAGRLSIEAIDEAQGIYRISTTDRSLSLTAPADADGEAPVWRTPDPGDVAQQWRFEAVEAKGKFTAAMRDEMMQAYLHEHLHTIGNSYRTFYNGGWGEAEQLEVLLDAYEATQQDTYLAAARQVYAYFKTNVGDDWTKGGSNGYNWFGYDFNDDVMWQIIAVARLGRLTGQKVYTIAAKKNFDRIYTRAYIPFTGLLRWAEQSGDRYGTNSCINGPAEVAACYLGMSGCGEEYFEKARDLYAAQRRHLANNMATGKVWDNVVWDPSTERVKSKNEWASTYNQGTMLGAACLLYLHYGEGQYLSDARKIMSYTKAELCDSYGIIRVCQDESNGDLCGFKGILMRYVRRFVLDLEQTTYKEWMLRNAFHAYCNRSAKGLTGTGWLKKATDDSTTSAFGCSTAASAAVNAPLEQPTDDPSAVLSPSSSSLSRPSGGPSYYTLSGIPLSAAPPHGAYIIRQNATARVAISTAF